MKNLGDQHPDRPGQQDWGLQKDETQGSQSRERYSLAGIWRCQLLGCESLPVPVTAGIMASGERQADPWKIDDTRWYGAKLPVAPVLSDNGTPEILPPQPLLYRDGAWVEIDQDAGLDLKSAVMAWYERDVTIPSSWKGKRVFLRVCSVRYYTDCYFNGKFIGSIAPRQALRFEITEHVQWGASNRVAMLNGTQAPISGRVPERVLGINGDIFLETWERLPCTVSDPLFFSDVRQGKLGVRAVFENTTGKSLETTVSVRLVDVDTGKPAKEQPEPVLLTLPPSSSEERDVLLPFPDAHLWTPDDPHLYKAWVGIDDASSRDESFVETFGFRQVEHAGRNVLINGRTFEFKGTSHNVSLLSAPPEIAGTYYPSFTTGLNCTRVFTPIYSVCLDRNLNAGDRTGFMYHVHVGSPPANESEFQAYMKYFKWTVRRFGNHPSVTMWRTGDSPATASGLGSKNFCPALLADPPPGKYPGAWEDMMQLTRKYLDACKRADPQARPWYDWHGGHGLDMRAMYNFFGYDVPLQTREEWPAYWAEHANTALMDEQVAYPCDTFYGYLYHRGWNPREIGNYTGFRFFDNLWIEWAASCMGNGVYTNTPMKLAESYAYPCRDRGGYWPPCMKEYPSLVRHFYWDLKNLFVKWTNRSWRTYGVSVLLHAAYTMSNVIDDGTKPYFDSLRRHQAPLYVYIGGEQGAFVRKDHAFFEHETVKKQFISINNFDADVLGTVHYSLHDRGTENAPQGHGKCATHPVR